MYQMRLWIEIVLGGLAALGFIAWARRRGARGELTLYAWGLAVAALIYVGFSLGAGGTDLGLELLGVAIYGVLAWLGWRHAPWLLAVGWAGHVIWDLALHGVATPHVPGWYPGACLGFDLLVAARILALGPLPNRH